MPDNTLALHRAAHRKCRPIPAGVLSYRLGYFSRGDEPKLEQDTRLDEAVAIGPGSGDEPKLV
ncbi:hypothetical protein FACS1894137_12000 [Spirochaetia bacterium]|nr:hypothetical protein FACS1894137_12000 [Spirochaetia bacterium]